MLMLGLISIAVFGYGLYLSCINGNKEIEHYIRPESPHNLVDTHNLMMSPPALHMESHIEIDIPENDEIVDVEDISDQEDISDKEGPGEQQEGEVTQDDETVHLQEEISSSEEEISTLEGEIDSLDDETMSLEEENVTVDEGEGELVSERTDGIDDLWSSYQLEKKYDEMKEKKPLKGYLDLREWKMAVRRRFRDFIESHWFRADPERFIRKERSKRNKDEYAVIDDTALNLVEYYHLKSSKEQ
jgi:hypothetical protein